MSLVLYSDETNDDSDEYRVILHKGNKKTLVLQNKTTNQVSLVNNHKTNTLTKSSTLPLKCPHCGSYLDGQDSRQDEDDGHNRSFMHSNYFKLLAESDLTTALPNNIFTQGYYSKFFKELELLGRGSRGSVYKVEHILNNVPLGTFALKKITIGEDPKWLLKVLNEVHMLVKISSNTANLVSYNHVWLEVDSINDFGPKVPCAFILQQYCSGGNLEDFINFLKEPKLTVKQMKQYKIRQIEGRLLSNEEILIIFLQIVNGVLELHKNHIIHRDLKPSNCLLSSNYLSIPNLLPNIELLPNILIGDFGESQIEGSKRSKSGSTGTLEYCAPELIYEMKEFNKKTDVYSLGMILYFICFGELPFKSKDINDLKDEILHMKVLKLKDKRNDLKDGFIELIINLTQKDWNKRMETNQILNKLNEISLNMKSNDDELEQSSIKENNVMSIDDNLTRSTSIISNEDLEDINDDDEIEDLDGNDIESTSYNITFDSKKLILITLQLSLLINIALNYEVNEMLKYILIFLTGISLQSNEYLSYFLLALMSLINIYNEYIKYY